MGQTCQPDRIHPKRIRDSLVLIFELRIKTNRVPKYNGVPLAGREVERDLEVRAEDVEALREDVVVDEPGVDGAHAHHEDDVAPSEEDLEDLGTVHVLLKLLLLHKSFRAEVKMGQHHHLQDHPDGKEQHDGAVPGVPEHDREEEGEGGNCVHCRVHLQVERWRRSSW